MTTLTVEPPRASAQRPSYQSERPIARPINWLTLTAQEARAEYEDLNQWVEWLRDAFGLAPTEIPPLWHRHDALIWELSALHTYWLDAYDDANPADGPYRWLRDFGEARQRLRDWVAACGTRLDRDRPTRRTAWPGEAPIPPGVERPIVDRRRDFLAFLDEDAAQRPREWG